MHGLRKMPCTEKSRGLSRLVNVTFVRQVSVVTGRQRPAASSSPEI